MLPSDDPWLTVVARGRGLLYDPLSAVVALGRNPKTVFEKADPVANILLGDLLFPPLVPLVISTGPIYRITKDVGMVDKWKQA